MRRMRNGLMLATAITSVLAGGVYGAEISSYILDPVLVTAQRTEKNELQTPASTTVMTEESIQKTAATNVFDALSFTTGMSNFSYGPGGLDYGAMDSRINIRGLERGALILVDGAPINLNGKNSLSGVLTNNVKRIEVVKGASSTLYGAEALGGVVNVITKNTSEPYAAAHIGFGSRGYRSVSLDGGNEKVRLAFSKEKHGGINPSTPVRTDIGNKKGYKYYSTLAPADITNASVQVKLNEEWDVRITHTKTDSTFGQIVAAGTLNKDILKAAVEKKKAEAIKKNPKNKVKEEEKAAKAIKKIEASDDRDYSNEYHYNDKKLNVAATYKKGDMKAVVFYNDRDLYGESRNLKDLKWSANTSNYIAKKYGIDAQHVWSLREGNDSLVAGVLVSRDTYKGTSSANDGQTATRNNFAVYGSYSHMINPSLTGIVGLRYQHIDDPVKDQNVLMPQFQLLHTLNDNESLYMNIGKAFTMPQLDKTQVKADGKYKNVSGTNLKPEEGWNYEVGYKAVNEKDTWRVALFHMNFDNFFDWVKDDSGVKSIMVNTGKFRNTGIEVDYKTLMDDYTTLSLGASYSNPEKQSGKGWTQAYPKLQLTAGVHYAKDAWRTGASLNWLTKRLQNRDGGTNPDLINLNAYVAYDFDAQSSLRLDLRNILDRKNVITNGDWEYWDQPFTVTLSYDRRF